MSTELEFSRIAFPALRDAVHERLELQAFSRGHASGYAAGLAAGNKEIQARLARLAEERAAEADRLQIDVDRLVGVLNQAALALRDCTVPLLDDVQDSLASAAIQIAEAILGYELRDEKRSARAALARAIDHVDPADVVAIRMNPSDIAAIHSETRERVNVVFTADPSVHRGDAIAEFPDGYLDAQIGTALARVRAALLGEGR